MKVQTTISSSSTLKDKTITTNDGLTSTKVSDIVDVDKLVLSGSKAYGDGKIRLAQDGTLFINVNDVTGANDVADVDDSSITYNSAEDVTVGKVKVGQAANSGDLDTTSTLGINDDNIITGLKLKDGKTKGKFTVAITSSHDSAIIVSKDVNINITTY